MKPRIYLPSNSGLGSVLTDMETYQNNIERAPVSLTADQLKKAMNAAKKQPIKAGPTPISPTKQVILWGQEFLTGYSTTLLFGWNGSSWVMLGRNPLENPASLSVHGSIMAQCDVFTNEPGPRGNFFYLSTDEASSWTLSDQSEVMNDGNMYRLRRTVDGTYWLIDGSSIWRSIDQGDSWDNPIPSTLFTAYLATHNTQNYIACIYQTSLSSVGPVRVSVSLDSGSSFSSNDASGINGAADIANYARVCWIGDRLVAVWTFIEGFYPSYTTLTYTSFSDDFGITWSTQLLLTSGSFPGNDDTYPALLIPSSNKAFIFTRWGNTSSSGIFFRGNGSSWETLNKPISAADYPFSGAFQSDGSLWVLLNNRISNDMSLWSLANAENVIPGSEVWTEINLPDFGAFGVAIGLANNDNTYYDEV